MKLQLLQQQQQLVLAQWLAHLEFELVDPGSNPGSRHYSIGQQPWASCLLSLPPQFLSSKKLGYKTGSFRRLSGYGDQVR